MIASTCFRILKKTVAFYVNLIFLRTIFLIQKQNLGLTVDILLRIVYFGTVNVSSTVVTTISFEIVIAGSGS